MLGWRRRRPYWSCAQEGGWHDAWFSAAETADPLACMAGASQLLGSLRDVAARLRVFQPRQPNLAQQRAAPGQLRQQLLGFSAVGDAVILACRAAECWDGRCQHYCSMNDYLIS
jgi:hypothetical protein